ncbi:MAG: DUF2334 domain-containing protein [Proteobacteria bacterium]|nr:DUF2334 domain-containing protein [Pseudomonadota bacterium]
MKYVVIRDDDICFFTKPEMLETLYKPLLDLGKPVTLSVVPAIHGGQSAGPLNGPFWDRFQLDYSPCLPPHKRAEAHVSPLTADCEIVNYIHSRPEYEIAQHGYNHIAIEGIREGLLTDRHLITERLEASRAIMQECFGRPSDFFVVPWDDVSAETITILKHYFKGISLHRLGQRHVSWSRKLQAIGRRFMNDRIRAPYFQDGDFLLLEYPGPILSMFNDYKGMKELTVSWLKNHDILVMVNHYWEYFWDWGEPNREFLSAWHDIAAYLLDRPDVEIISFSTLYDHLYS